MKFTISVKAAIIAFVFVGVAHSTPNPNLYKRTGAVEAQQAQMDPQVSPPPQDMGQDMMMMSPQDTMNPQDTMMSPQGMMMIGPQDMTETNGAASAEPAVVRPSGPSCPPPLRPFFTHCQIGPDCASCLQKELPACAKTPLEEKDLIIKPQEALCGHCSERAIYYVCTKEGVAEDAARKKAAAQSSSPAPVSTGQEGLNNQNQAAPAANDGPK